MKSADLTPGTIVEASIAGLLDTVYPGDSLFNASKTVPFAAGDQFEVESCKGKPIILKMKHIPSGLSGACFFVMAPGLKIISTPEKPPEADKPGESAIKLGENQEYVVVLKSNPALVFRGFAKEPIAGDIQHGQALFHPKSGQRKAFKNIQALVGFLNNASGAYDSEATFRWHSAMTPRQAMNMRADRDRPDWVNGSDHRSELELMELRKYDKAARKILAAAIPLNLRAFADKAMASIELTLAHGEAVSALAQKLAEADGFEQGWILNTWPDESKFETHEAPTDKDLHLELAIKASKIDKKSTLGAQKNGFTAAAFKNQSDAELALAAYQGDGSKKTELIRIATLAPKLDTIRKGALPKEEAQASPASQRIFKI